MSWSVRCKFFRKNKDNSLQLISDSWMDCLKKFSSTSYMTYFEHINCTYDKIEFSSESEINHYYESEYIGLLDKSLLSKKGINLEQSKIKNNCSRDDCLIYEVDEDDMYLYAYKECIVDINLNEFTKLSTEEKRKKYLNLYVRKWVEKKGDVYDINSFSNAKEYYLNLYKEDKSKLQRLNEIKNSVDYYKLSSDEKDDLLQDIEWTDEGVKQWNNYVEDCEFMIRIMSYFKYDMIDDNYMNFDKKIYCFIYGD